jgi:hypothetical protein
MPRPASRNFGFEPEQIRAMHRAFEAVCAELQLSIGLGDRVTELVGQRIIELAMAGERDANIWSSFGRLSRRLDGQSKKSSGRAKGITSSWANSRSTNHYHIPARTRRIAGLSKFFTLGQSRDGPNR